MNNEPVAVGAAIIGFGSAAIAVVNEIQTLTPGLVTALNGALAAAVVLVGAIVRSKVTPV